MKQAIIMAAGKGTRMMSNKPKVLHKICGKTMIEQLVSTISEVNVDRICTIVGYGRDEVMNVMKDKCEFAIQEPQLGTGHAVMMAKQFNGLKGKTLVVNGDCPCLSKETFEKMYEQIDLNTPMCILTVVLDNPKSYGRVIKGKDGLVKKIVEYKDSNEEEKKIREINTGIYCFDNELLFKYLEEIKANNSQKEYYVTDLVEIFNNHGHQVKAYMTENIEEVQGINNKLELAKANKYLKKSINEKLLINGVELIDPDNTYISSEVTFGKDCIVYPNVTIEGKCIIGSNTVIESGSFIKNSNIGNNCHVMASRITDSTMKNGINIGPNSHLRNGCVIEDDVRIGNYVEFKNTHFGFNSKCAHLTYIGDADVGAKCNMGCGVVTVNYDGVHKFRTTIKDGAFIGSNANLIAPIVIGKNAVVAAGSTVDKDVEDGAMAIARPYQVNKPNYGEKYKNKEKK
jgi:bifunctional UDP-N-acetylglucosamine pyrophosphorylase/glucosamine-1-phosphate N-acetyltransferase